MTDSEPTIDVEATTPRHYSSFAFYKVDPAWRRLDEQTREEHKAELTEVLDSWSDRLTLGSYSTVGIRPDADFCLWRATPELELLQQMQTDLLSTGLGAWLDTTYLYTSTTKPSQYQRDVRSEGFVKPRPLDIIHVDRKYMIVYPFVKKREWYALPREDRGAMMREHAVIGKNYPGIKLNPSYSVRYRRPGVHDGLRDGFHPRIPRPDDGAAQLARLGLHRA